MEKQLKTMTCKCRKLLQSIFKGKKVILMDDAKHFTFGNPEISANTGFWTKNKNMAPNNVKHKSKAKFEPYILVWLVISPYGVSKPFKIHTKTSKRSNNFLATSNIELFCKKTWNWLNDNKIKFVPNDLIQNMFRNRE
jgi:hypothetical protein